MSAQPVIDVKNLAVDYKGKSGSGKPGRTRAVDGVTFAVKPGECVGFIGPNGAGKSSTMKALMGFIFPAEGEVRVFGASAGTVESKLRIGYLPEVTLYYPFLKGTELLELYGGLQRVPRSVLKQRIPAILHQVGLSDFGSRLIRNYSKGMQQRLGIAQALIAEPDCLIFDELSSGLDPVGRHDLRQVLVDLKSKGTTIFFSSHELYEVEALCDRVVAIHKGKLLFDLSLSELRQRAGTEGLESYFMSLVRKQESAS